MLGPFFYTAIFAWLIWYFLFKPNPPPICGVYPQPGKWYMLKYWFFFAIYKIRQRRKPKLHQEGSAGYGVKSRNDVSEMDKPQILPEEHSKAVDAVYFNASNKEGVYLVAATARRHGDLVQTVLIIRIPGVGTLELPGSPDTHLKASDPKAFAADGLSIKPVIPMKKWAVNFDGIMKLNGKKFGQVHLDLEFHALSEYFDFDTDMSPFALSKGIAAETWSKDFFDRLKTAHQTHYEQFGDYKGHVHLKPLDKEVQLSLRGVRDHSYGNTRDWKYFHRYTLNMFHLEDGTCINASIVSMPNVTISKLELGFVWTPDGRKLSVDQVNLRLHLLGETQPPPTTFAYNFWTSDGKRYDVECEIIDRTKFYMGEEWEGTVWEQMARFVCNGKKGWGFAEWEYRNMEGKPKQRWY